MRDAGLRLSLPQTRGQAQTDSYRKLLRGCFLCAALVCALLLFALPEGRNGLKALCNGLFSRSEAVNRYRYERFQVPPGQETALSAGLLSVLCGAAAGLLFTSGRRLPAVIAAALLAVGQAYYGLSLPVWANGLCFAALGLLLMRPVSLKKGGLFLAAVLLMGAVLLTVWPQIDEMTEAASEQARDWLTPAAQPLDGELTEEALSPRKETRRVNTQSLKEGEQGAQAEREYRLVTVEEEQISRPRWIDYLKIALLLLLSVALVILPFVPFAILNRRRRQAQALRERFSSADHGEAVWAMFGHVIRYLTACGYGAGNRLYRAWAPALAGRLPEDYLEAFEKCSLLYEEAAYSDHELTEEQAGQVSALLAETEELLFDRADWKQRFRLRYVECLHE